MDRTRLGMMVLGIGLFLILMALALVNNSSEIFVSLAVLVVFVIIATSLLVSLFSRRSALRREGEEETADGEAERRETGNDDRS